MNPMRKIDIFNHVYPAAYYARLMQVAPNYKDIGKRMRNIPMLADLDERFRVMDTFAEYQQVLSLPTPPIENIADGAVAQDLSRAANDGMAELVSRYPDRFPGFVASVAYDDPDAAVRETVRALDDLGARGIQMFTNVHGVPMSDARFVPIFAALAARDLPIWIHPFRGADMTDYKSEARSEYEIWWTFGWPYETSAAMARMVFAGYFDRWPEMKIITHHMGAMAPYFAGRIGPGWDQLGARTSDQDLSAVLKSLKKRPLDYFKMFYGDTALFGAYDATVCGLNFFGADHVLFASDAPFDPEKGPMYIRDTIAVVDRLPISHDERERIYWRNAVRLLKLA
jgi:predicted TIM-barrel fold metal-dependent hydrolase